MRINQPSYASQIEFIIDEVKEVSQVRKTTFSPSLMLEEDNETLSALIMLDEYKPRERWELITDVDDDNVVPELFAKYVMSGDQDYLDAMLETMKANLVKGTRKRVNDLFERKLERAANDVPLKCNCIDDCYC